LIRDERLRSKEMLQSRVIRLFLLNLLRLICFLLCRSVNITAEVTSVVLLLFGNLISDFSGLHLPACAHGHQAKLASTDCALFSC